MMRKKKYELPSGSFRRQVTIGTEQILDEQGRPVYDAAGKPKMKQIRVSVTGRDKAEVNAEIDRLRSLRNGSAAEMTVADAIDKYISDSSHLLEPTTIHSYRIIQRCAFADIMHVKIRSLSNSRLREAVNMEAHRPKQQGGKIISSKTLANEYGLLRAVLNTYLPDLDTTVPLPQVVSDKHMLTEPGQIFEIVRGTEIELPVLLAMWMSFTASEILGLYKSKSISPDGKYISILQTQVNVGGREITKETTKTKTRRRTHRIPEYIRHLIDAVPGDKLVPLSHKALSNRFIRAIDRAGLPHMTFHDLRHVNASVMAMLQVPDKYAQERGGWASDAVMKNTYMQTFTEARVAVDNTIDAYFEQNLGLQQESIPESDLVKIRDCENAIKALYQSGYGYMVERIVKSCDISCDICTKNTAF